MKKEEMMLKATQMMAKGKFKLKKASPTIMIVGAAIGGVTAAVLACKATLKAEEIIAEHNAQVETIHTTKAQVDSGEMQLKDGETYTADDMKKDITATYVHTAVWLAKVYQLKNKPDRHASASPFGRGGCAADGEGYDRESDEMLTIQIPGEEYWDADREEFICRKATTLALEHSLLSLSKWESKWHVPFLDAKNGLTPEQMQDYVRCMTLNKGVPDEAYRHLTQENCTAIYTYMNDPMTATWFREDENTNKAGPRSGKSTASAVTSEVLYYDMVELGIPFECEKWHLNRLLTLIRVCNEKHKPPKKVSKSEQAARRKALNAKRKKELGTRG